MALIHEAPIAERTDARTPPGPSMPALGQFVRWIRGPIPFMEECARRFGDSFTLQFPGYPPIVFFSDPAAIQEIFVGDPECLRAGEANAVFAPVLGRHSLLVLDGACHQRERRLLTPTFHRERVRSYDRVVASITAQAIGSWPRGRPFPIHPHMQAITLEAILQIVVGLKDQNRRARLRDRLSRFLSMFTNPFALMALWCFQFDMGRLTPWGRMIRLRREVAELVLAEIAHRRVADGAGEDMLAMMTAARDEAGLPMTDAELRDEVMTVLVAGHETTAPALAWVLERVLGAPDVLEKIRSELERVGGDDPLAPDRIDELDYLEGTIKETLRLVPTIVTVGRLLHAPMRIGDVELPRGVVVAPCIYLAHRRPDVWRDPERFSPERFLNQRPTPYEYLPFGGGVRYCLGAEFATRMMKVVLAHVLSRVELRLAPGYRSRIVRRGTSLVPSEGMPVVVERSR